jgi:hypothetical protein
MITGKPKGATGEDRWGYWEGTLPEQMTGGELIRTAHGGELTCLGKMLPLVRGRVAVRRWDELGVRAERVGLVARVPQKVTTSDAPLHQLAIHLRRLAIAKCIAGRGSVSGGLGMGIPVVVRIYGAHIWFICTWVDRVDRSTTGHCVETTNWSGPDMRRAAT